MEWLAFAGLSPVCAAQRERMRNAPMLRFLCLLFTTYLLLLFAFVFSSFLVGITCLMVSVFLGALIVTVRHCRRGS